MAVFHLQIRAIKALFEAVGTIVVAMQVAIHIQAVIELGIDTCFGRLACGIDVAVTAVVQVVLVKRGKRIRVLPAHIGSKVEIFMLKDLARLHIGLLVDNDGVGVGDLFVVTE